MTRSKFMIGVFLTVLLLVTQVAVVGAAPSTQEEPPLTGNVENILLEEDPESGEVTVVVTLSFENGEPQTVRLSLQTALDMGLVVDDETGTETYVIVETMYGEEVTIDPTIVLLEEEEKEHPVGSAISEFFSDLLGVDYETVMDYHDDGTGFGVIAQALWMTNALEGDTEVFGAILDAKRSGDYSAITLPDGSTPQNWGQFRKAVMSDRDKSKENLGAIMSGRAEKDGSEGSMKPKNNPKGSDTDNNGNNGNKDNNGNNDKNKDKSKNKGKGHNK